VASREEIRVDVVSKYDDTGADAAIKDAALIDKLSPTVDIDTRGAQGALSGFKKSVGDTFKAIKSLAVIDLSSAISSVASFAREVVTGFMDAAIAAGQLSDASGLAVEDASRWIAVGDDIGVSGDTMSSAFTKLALNLGKHNKVLEKYGIATVEASNGQVDMNATMLEAIDVINAIQDPTEKATVANAAFGKGWTDLSELVAQGSDVIVESMAAVSDAQITDPEERRKADELRASLDDLGDTWNDMKLNAGEGLLPVVNAAAQGANVTLKTLGAIGQGTFDLFSGARRFVDSSTDANFENAESWNKSVEAAAEFDRTLIDGLTTWAQVHDVVLQNTDDLTAANLVANEFADNLERAADAQLGPADFGHAPAAGIAAIAETNADRRAAALANAQGTTNVFLPPATPDVTHSLGNHYFVRNSMRTGP
jgi:hypothetical protein